MVVACQHWNIMSHRIPIRRHSPIRSKKLIALSFQLHESSSGYKLPLKRRVGLRSETLDYLFTRSAQQKCVIRSHQVKIVHAFQPDGVPFWDELNSPDNTIGIPTFLLRDWSSIVVSPKIFACVRQQSHRMCVSEELHGYSILRPVQLR